MDRNEFIKILNEYYSFSPPVRYSLAIDFDGTLCNSSYPKLGEEIAPICNFIRSIMDLDFNLILYTCRHGDNLDDAIVWCAEHDIYFDYVNENPKDRVLLWGDCAKLSYDLLIDDKTFNFNIKDFS